MEIPTTSEFCRSGFGILARTASSINRLRNRSRRRAVPAVHHGPMCRRHGSPGRRRTTSSIPILPLGYFTSTYTFNAHVCEPLCLSGSAWTKTRTTNTDNKADCRNAQRARHGSFPSASLSRARILRELPVRPAHGFRFRNHTVHEPLRLRTVRPWYQAATDRFHKDRIVANDVENHANRR